MCDNIRFCSVEDLLHETCCKAPSNGSLVVCVQVTKKNQLPVVLFLVISISLVSLVRTMFSVGFGFRVRIRTIVDHNYNHTFNLISTVTNKTTIGDC